MNPAETTSPGILPDLMSELQLAADRAAKGIRDPEATRQACERMNRISEQIRQRHGLV
jgi:hypothetical protein